MSHPTVFFCPANTAEDLSRATGFPIVKLGSDGVRKYVDRLDHGESIIVTDHYILLMGWEAPVNTAMIFIEGFPTEGLKRTQAESRVRRLNRSPTA